MQTPWSRERLWYRGDSFSTEFCLPPAQSIRFLCASMLYVSGKQGQAERDSVSLKCITSARHFLARNCTPRLKYRQRLSDRMDANG